MHLVSERIHARMTPTDEILGFNVLVGERGVPIALEEVQLVLIWVEDRRQVDLASLKLYLVLVLYQAFTCEIVNLPIGVWVSIGDRATENKDTAASHWE